MFNDGKIPKFFDFILDSEAPIKIAVEAIQLKAANIINQPTVIQKCKFSV
jgi:hypothetical protein